MQLPAANRHGCVSYEASHDALVLVDRFKCSVVAQALQAQAARAHVLIVRGTKEYVYEVIRREHAPDSKPVFEYDCSRGKAFVASLARWPHPCALRRRWCRDHWYVHRRTYWVYQDLMGICLCVAFLRTVAFPNLRVATLLLSLACCYDMFFVFVSPLVFGSSVMEDVATGGPAAHTKRGYPGVDYCDCNSHMHTACMRQPLPILLVLPRVYNWMGGVCLIGLGDVIVPGLLLVFTLRYFDAHGGTNYFRLMALAYASVLAMANVAVFVSNMVQPALLYLVPTTLGALLVLSKCRGDLDAMWTGQA
ncbi:hypothetical protein PsorP6_019307 [Peronosclerospora sorghi]|nr:hypothetical protein PsorP6_019307 [Peronosclerospora sorghi]